MIYNDPGPFLYESFYTGIMERDSFKKMGNTASIQPGSIINKISLEIYPFILLVLCFKKLVYLKIMITEQKNYKLEDNMNNSNLICLEIMQIK